jgi:hypothetical protein
MTGPLQSDILADIQLRGIRRLTHFTLCSNLPRIFETGSILSTSAIASQGVPNFTTDFGRYDGHPELICCNIEYPNGYYFAQAKSKTHLVNYREWAVLLLDPQVAARPGTLFSPINAAKGSGRALQPGVDGLRRMWAADVEGRQRAASHWAASPTDVQAEVQVPGPIALSDVHGIVMLTDDDARIQQNRLAHLGQDPSLLDWYVSSDFFSVPDVRTAIQSGRDLPLHGPIAPNIKETH